MTDDDASEDAPRQQPVGPLDIAQWWGFLAPGSREWLIQHNGEPLEPTVKAEILELNHGRTDGSWWRGDFDEGESELTAAAIDWIEMVANDEV